MWRNLPDFWAEKNAQNPVASLAVMVFWSGFYLDNQSGPGRENRGRSMHAQGHSVCKSWFPHGGSSFVR